MIIINNNNNNNNNNNKTARHVTNGVFVMQRSKYKVV